MKKTPNPRCKTIKPDGTQCGAYSIGEHGYCISCARKNGLYIDKPKPVVEPDKSTLDSIGQVITDLRQSDPGPDATWVVAEPVALTALREQTAQEIDRKPVDPVDKVAVVNQIRQLLGMLGLTGEEVFDFPTLGDKLKPRDEIVVRASAPGRQPIEFRAKVRIDTPVELQYYRNGGILQTVLRKLLKRR